MSEPQMGFEPTTLCALVGCSNHWGTGDSVVSTGQIVGIDWNRIARWHSHALGSYELTNSIESTRSRRVVGSNPSWGSDFSESTFPLEYHVVVVVSL